MAAPMTPPPDARDFLADCGWAGANILPLAGDASFRRYFRVVEGNRSAVLMDAPPPHENPRPFIAVAEWLIGHGLSAPEILARDLDKGLLLLGDFGNSRLRETLDTDPARERELYELATDVLVQLHKHPPMAGLRPHGVAEWLEEKLGIVVPELGHERAESIPFSEQPSKWDGKPTTAQLPMLF